MVQQENFQIKFQYKYLKNVCTLFKARLALTLGQNLTHCFGVCISVRLLISKLQKIKLLMIQKGFQNKLLGSMLSISHQVNWLLNNRHTVHNPTLFLHKYCCYIKLKFRKCFLTLITYIIKRSKLFFFHFPNDRPCQLINFAYWKVFARILFSVSPARFLFLLLRPPQSLF
jgi:hypothetical protein